MGLVMEMGGNLGSGIETLNVIVVMRMLVILVIMMVVNDQLAL